MGNGDYHADDNDLQIKQKCKQLKQDWDTLSTDDKLLRMRKILSRMANGAE